MPGSQLLACREVVLTRLWFSAFWCAALLVVATDTSAQCRVEGTLLWVDGTPATAIVNFDP